MRWIKHKPTQMPRRTYCVGNYCCISHRYKFKPGTRESGNVWKCYTEKDYSHLGVIVDYFIKTKSKQHLPASESLSE